MKVLVLAALLVFVVLLVSSSAMADPRIGLSRDGVTWVSQLADPLFDAEIVWVPGDARTESFYVRNQATEAAELSVALLGTDAAGLVETGDLTIAARGGGTGWRSTDEKGTRRLVSEVGVGTNRPARVDITVTFAASSVNASQTRTLDLDLRVRLTQAVSATGPGTDDGRLPGTGGPAGWILLSGVGLLGTGTALVSIRRRRAASDV